jgi:FtsZ-binding cell division protein ZapB
LERQQNAFTEIHNENLTLKSENRSLKNAIERFLELGAMKGITEGAKTLLERFNAAIMTVKMTFSKNQELTQENNSLKTQITAQQEREQSQSMNHGYSRGGGGMSL